MNAAYAYDTQEASSIITNRIYYLLELRHWSVKTLSDESNIPYETLKKLLSRKTENTSFHNIMKIALAFKCNLNYLIEPLEEADDSESTDTLGTTLDFYSDFKDNTEIPLFYPSSSAIFNTDTAAHTSRMDTLDISSYSWQIRNSVDYGIVVSSYCYHPIYNERDVLLISRKRSPLPGETGIFLHHGNLYVRIFSKNFNSIILESVNGIGPDIQIYDFSEWTIVGYVVGVHKL